MDTVALPYRISVLAPDDSHAFWADEAFARELLREKKAVLIWRGRRAIALRSVVDRVELMELAGRGSALGGARYSHKREDANNIAGVWALKRLARDRRLYSGVLVSVSNAS